MMLVYPLSHKHFRPETVVDICFLPPRRLTVTTGRGYLVLLKIKATIKPRITFNDAIMLIFIFPYIIGHYVIQSIYIPIYSSLYPFISVALYG